MASGTDSVAIGNGATATRDGQVAVGGENSTYTMAGLGSSASTAAQSGDIGVVTTDRNGNLAADFSVSQNLAAQSLAISQNTSAIQGNSAAIQNNTAAILAAVEGIEFNSQAIAENRGGIAAAIALDTAYVPLGQTWAVSGGYGFYDSEGAFAGSIAYRINDTFQLNGGLTTGTDNGKTGGRAGFQASW